MVPKLFKNMDCAKENCPITGNDRMVSCWLCTGLYHLKCCGLKARDADAILDPAKSLHWTCPSCRNINVEFYNLFKNSKEQFDKLNSEFQQIQNKLNVFGELFTKYPHLDKLATDKNQSSSHNMSINNPPQIFEPVNINPQIISPSCAASPSLDANIFPVNNDQHLPVNNVQHLHTQRNNIAHMSPLSSSGSITPTITVNSVTRTNTQNNCNNPIYQPLRVIPPKKSVFVSRFAYETSTTDVEYYIKSKLCSDVDVIVYKFKYSRPRSVVSFKISVPIEIFHQIVDPNFWPMNTLVKEYINNDTQRPTMARLPSITSNMAKN